MGASGYEDSREPVGLNEDFGCSSSTFEAWFGGPASAGAAWSLSSMSSSSSLLVVELAHRYNDIVIAHSISCQYVRRRAGRKTKFAKVGMLICISAMEVILIFEYNLIADEYQNLIDSQRHHVHLFGIPPALHRASPRSPLRPSLWPRNGGL